MSPTTQEGCILTGSAGTAFIARFEGHLTQRSMWNMNHVVERYRAAGAPSDVIVDVAHCSYMDSTMLGLLARWAMACAGEHGVNPYLVGLADGELRRIFRRMSIDRLFRISTLESPPAAWTPAVPEAGAAGRAAATGAGARKVLAAHETLAELSPANAAAFDVLITLLRNEVADGA